MATISKLGSGKYRVQVRRRGTYSSKSFNLKSDAERWAREAERKLDRGESLLRRGPRHLRTFGDLIDVHIADMQDVGKPLRRSKAYSLDLLKRELGHHAFQDLTREKLIEFGRTRARGGAGPATVGAEISYTKTILSHSAAVHGVSVSGEEVDLCRVALKRLGIVGKSQERNRRPTEDELEELFAYFEDWTRLTIPMTQIVKFAIGSAMRQSEICSVTWPDLDTPRRTILVRDRKDPRDKDGNNQTVPLTDFNGVDLMALLEARKATRYSRKARIFPYNSRSVGAAFRRACKACDIEDLVFHDLRHEATSRLFEAGLSIERTALITGHKDWKMLRRYTHLAPDMVFHPPRIL